MATASAAGRASGGRSRYFQLMLAGFGLHARCGHLAARRGAPFAAWAVRRLKAAGTWEKLSARDIVPGTTLALAVFVGSHALARGLNRS
jgi:hypothetical protein